jgi:hypothetical protein
MVEIPPGVCGNSSQQIVTPSFLSPPDGEKLSASTEAVCHFQSRAFLKVFFVPCIEWICRTGYFDMTFNPEVRCFLQA